MIAGHVGWEEQNVQPLWKSFLVDFVGWAIVKQKNHWKDIAKLCFAMWNENLYEWSTVTKWVNHQSLMTHGGVAEKLLT